MGFVIKMAPGVTEGILRSSHENFPSRQVFKKKRVENPKNSIFVHICKIVVLNTDLLKPSLLSEINN